jgi:outer membrane protein assembly factor BamB
MRETDRQSSFSSQLFSKKWRAISLSALALALIAAGLLVAFSRHQPTYAVSPGDWSGYMSDIGRSGFNGTETIINPTSAPSLKMHWSLQASGTTFSQPVVANGMVYWGSSDGYERATDLNGGLIWQQNLGQTTWSCRTNTTTLGVISTATVTSLLINGTLTSVVFVGGGDDHLYALDDSTGVVLWSTLLGAPLSNTFIWDSPVAYNNSVYIGTASIGDCPLIPGQLLRLDAVSGTIQNTFNVVPAGCKGGGIWGSPTIDQSDNSVYFTTGNSSSHCATKASNAVALVKLNATDLSFISAWQVPTTEQGKDSDFGSTPTLFQATIGSTLYQLVGAVNKNGTFYTFDRTNISNGPVWSSQIAVGGGCPECGQGSISPAAWDGTTLYIAGGKTTINGAICMGSLRALNPVDGSFLWQDCLVKTLLGAVTAVPGVVAIVEGSKLVLVNATSGATLFISQTSTPARFYGSSSVSNGVLYVGGRDSYLYAFGI